MELYESNMAFIQSKASGLYRTLVAPKCTSEQMEYLPDEDNFIIAGSNLRLYMHSIYNQAREKQALLDKIPNDTRVLVVFGLGNGQVLEKIRLIYPALKQVVVIDPNPEPMLSFLNRVNFENFCKSFKKISFIINHSLGEAENLLASVIPRYEKTTIIAQISYRTIYSGYYEALLLKTRDLVQMSAVNISTEEVHRNDWLVNVWRNIKHSSIDISAFADLFKGVPAILVSAGPSLNKNIHLLEEAKSRALIIAVGSAMTILHARGIVPHFRMAIDGSYLNNQIFDKVDTAACPLIYSNRLYHEIVPNYQAPVVQITMPDVDYLERYIFNQVSFNTLPGQSGFSVANTALDMLIQLGCSKVIFMGQDLCYTDGKMHAKGSWREHVRAEDESTVDGLVDISGNKVYSSPQFLGMKALIENLIEGSPRIQFINATEGGLAIKGVPNKPLSDVLQQDCCNEYPFDESIRAIWEKDQPNKVQRERMINQVVDGIAGMVAELIERSGRILSKLEKINMMIQQGVRVKIILEHIKSMNGLSDKQSKNAFFREVVHPLFAEKMNIRNNLLEHNKNNTKEYLAKEAQIIHTNMAELHNYLQITEYLIREYQTNGGSEVDDGNLSHLKE